MSYDNSSFQMNQLKYKKEDLLNEKGKFYINSKIYNMVKLFSSCLF